MSLKDVQTYFRMDFFQNGMAYYDADKVVNPSRYQNKIYAQVEGSGTSNYTVVLESGEKLKPHCSCPAARRYPFCKHVAAVLVAWARGPGAFVLADSAPELKKPGSKKARVKKGKTETKELIRRGLEALETLTTELILTGLSSITEGRVQQVRELAENLRTYKLRRLSTLLTKFAGVLDGLLTDKEHFSLAEYAKLLTDIVITAKGVQGIQQGKLQDPKYMEELVGKTWQEKDLLPRSALRLAGVYFDSYTTVDNFVVLANYFVELHSGEILTKKFITPEKQLKRSAPEDTCSYTGLKLNVQEALQYPGYPPYRLKLKNFDQTFLTAEDKDTIIGHAGTDFGDVLQAFQAFKKDFFAPDEYYTMLKPKGFLASGDQYSIFDSTGKAFELQLSAYGSIGLEMLLEMTSIKGLFGKLDIEKGNCIFQPLSALTTSPEKSIVAFM